MTGRLTRSLLAVIMIVISFAGCTRSYLPEPAVPPVLIFPVEPDTEDPVITPAPQPVIPDDSVMEQIDREFRAVWVASVLNLDFPTKQGLTAAAIKREIEAIVATTAQMGLNAVILQVRPAGDAFYKSEIFPWSAWLTGEQGKGIDGFDPLAYWLDVCKENDIELHAWLNPYRIIHTSTNSSDPETLAPDNPVRMNPDLAVAWTGSDGRSGLFLDPGLPEARQLIIDGIDELIKNYDVDGVHIDDYFYPGTDFGDAASFAEYGGDNELDDWRRGNVNELIRGIQAAVRKHNEASGKNVRWGVSPTAIWKNGSNDPLGVPATAGQESYHALYADTRLWVTEGWVDYICPQIYWYIGYSIADFEAVFNWWDELCASHDVDLYVGHAAYREFEDNQPPNWRGEIIRQLDAVAESETAGGSALYRYFSLRSNVGNSVRDYYAQKDDFPQREPVIVSDKLSVGFPDSDISIAGTPSTVPGYNIVGTGIADIPLYLNGEEVTERTPEGFFHVYVPLQRGDNTFTFSQDGADDVTRVITLGTGNGGASASTPTPAPTPAASITAVTELDYATVISDEAWVYSSNNTSDGIGYMLTPGQRDRITARSSNNLVRLSCGAWIRSDAVSVQRESKAITDLLSDGGYRNETDYDIISWKSSQFPAAIALFDNKKLTVRFGMQNSVPPLELPDDMYETLFESVSSGINNNVPYYEFTLKENARFEGYDVRYHTSDDESENELRVYLKKRKTLSDGDKPLAGITIMLDAGHGGDASGAIGPMGHDMPEKTLNLINTQNLAGRLGQLGAEVLLTREDDADVSLGQRVNLSRQAMPDLFISLHVNSVAETTNARTVRGFTVWYYQPNSIPLTETVRDVMQFINPGTNRDRVINSNNFVVCRPWWSPHILLEASFIMSLEDFVWLIDPIEQNRMAEATVDAILDYFSRT